MNAGNTPWIDLYLHDFYLNLLPLAADLLASADGSGLLNVWSMSSKSVIYTMAASREEDGKCGSRQSSEGEGKEGGPVSLAWLPNNTLAVAFPHSTSFRHVKLVAPESIQVYSH